MSGTCPSKVTVQLPDGTKPYSGRRISVPVESLGIDGAYASAGVVKDAGDDDDVTDGLLVIARVRALTGAGVRILGGPGVGVVTRPGLPVPVGRPAINPVPRAMIRRELKVLASPVGGFEVVIEVPEGERVAAKTWNPRIGITGGISIIGTSGVVEPKSSSAFKKTIVRTIRAGVAGGVSRPVLALGYVGERFLRGIGVPDDHVFLVGDHVGLALRAGARAGAVGLVLVGHVGKLVKVAAGIFNTNSRYGDARLETLAAHAGALGAPAPLIERILSLSLAEEATAILVERGYAAVFQRIAQRAAERSSQVCGLPVACTVLSIEGEELASNPLDLWRQGE
jgi:cobalt-precorrin-5B (C1)-methyltransferase